MRRNGFTLPELLIVMALMSLAMAVAGPPGHRAVTRRTVRSAVAEFEAAQGTARALAVQYGRTVELHLKPDAKEYWVEADTIDDGTDEMEEMFYRLFEEGELSSDRILLCYDGRGFPTTEMRDKQCEAPDATVAFTLPARADTVRISLLGTILR